MMVQMEEEGMEVDWSSLDEEEVNFPYEIQEAFQVWNYLTDQWDGMSGTYFGKQIAGIKDVMELLEVSNQKEIFKLVKIIDTKYSKHVNKKNKEQQAKTPKS
jgi:hypothetical protein